MKKNDLAEKVRTARVNAGLSQEALAEAAGLNLRTVQRIESGETEARGDTLNRLAAALSLSVTELNSIIPPPAYSENQTTNHRQLVWFNLSALSFYVFPLLGIIVPLIVAKALRTDDDEALKTTRARLINFQLTLFVIWIAGLCYSLSGINERGIGLGNMEIFLLANVLLYIFNFIMIVFNSFRLSANKPVLYQPAIPILR